MRRTKEMMSDMLMKMWVMMVMKFMDTAHDDDHNFEP